MALQKIGGKKQESVQCQKSEIRISNPTPTCPTLYLGSMFSTNSNKTKLCLLRVSSSTLKTERHWGRYLKASYDLRTRRTFQFLFFINKTTFGSDHVFEQETSLEGKAAKQSQASRERAAVLLLRLVPTWLATTACTTSKVSEYQIQKWNDLTQPKLNLVIEELWNKCYKNSMGCESASQGFRRSPGRAGGISVLQKASTARVWKKLPPSPVQALLLRCETMFSN